MKKRLLAIATMLFILPFGAQSVLAEEPQESPYLECTYTVPEGRESFAANLSDDDETTRLTLTPGQSVTVAWEGSASGVLISWYDVRENATMTLYDAQGNQISQSDYSQTEYRTFLPAENASKLVITCKRGNDSYASICELRVFSEGEQPKNLTEQESVDLMLILSGVTDETELLGGLLPLYTGEHGIKTAIVYVGRDYGYRVQEAFRAYAAMGIDVIPVFLQYEDHNTCSLAKMYSVWGMNKVHGSLLSVFRTYQPKVVVTCDPKDSFSMARVPYTAIAVQRFIVQSAEFYKLSVQKFYYLSESGETCLDWTQPLVSYDGMTAQDVAEIGYTCYRSEESFGTVIPKTSSFRLAYSRVGEDVLKNDLFENMDTDGLISYTVPTPQPTAEPTPQPTEEPTPTPMAVPTAEPMQVPTTEPTEGKEETAVLPCVLLAAAVVVLIAAILLLGKKKKLALALGACAVALAAVAIVLWIETTPARSVLAEETAIPVQTPTSEPITESADGPAEESAAEPTSEPTPTADPNDGYYRQQGDPEEVILSDYDAGHWEYRTDTLSIIIDRHTWMTGKHPQCMYVAHIRMREMDCFRGIVSSNYAVASASEPPWRLSRNFRSVLAITGDNLNNADLDFKGILIRNGMLFADGDGEATLVMDKDMTLRLVHPGEVSGIDLMDSGILHTFSFGPVLVENGEVNPDVHKHRVQRGNPRCGIGMVEPGHLIAIVVDGRDPSRAYNITLTEFAEIFAEQGVEMAYNLDGGSSSAMIFMGESISSHSGKDDPQRTWADALVWGYLRQVPSVTDPVYHDGD